jgi:hypothetical protein
MISAHLEHRQGAVKAAAWMAGEPVAAAKGAQSELAQQMVNELYTPRGLLPIKDLVIEVDDYISEDNGPSNLVCEANSKIFFKSPNRLRVDQVHRSAKSPLDGKMTVIIRDGENLWVYLEGQIPSKTGNDSQVPTLSIPFNIQRYRRDQEREFYYLGKEKLDGVTVHRVQITNPSMPDWTAVLWIDAERHIPIQLETTGRGHHDKMIPKRVVYGDIRRLPDGRFFPFKLQIFENDVLTGVELYKGVRINVGLDDFLFAPQQEYTNPGSAPMEAPVPPEPLPINP